MDVHLTHTGAYKAMLDRVLEQYHASGLRNHDRFTLRRGYRRVNLNSLLDDAYASGQLHLLCPVCGGRFLPVSKPSADVYRAPRITDFLLPKKIETHLKCQGCRLEIQQEKPLIEALADFVEEFERRASQGGLLDMTERELKRQFRLWYDAIGRQPPLLRRTAAQPLVPIHVVQVRNRQRAMEHVHNLLRTPRNLGFHPVDIQRVLRHFTGVAPTEHDNFFSFLEAHRVTTAYGEVSEKLLVQAISILAREENSP